VTPVLPRGVRLHHDRVRGTPVLLAPEHALMLDDIGAAILAEVDGVQSCDAISGVLAARYGAPAEEVGRDVAEFLGGLAARRLVDWR
jgi:pyrroloquinoline quinone biosynthesis protein D